MLIFRKMVGVIILWLCILVCQAICAEHGRDLIKGRAILTADRTVIAMPYNVKGIVFDTSRAERGSDTLPSWRYLGQLKVDSLILREGTVPLMDEAQTEGILISSENLLSAFYDINAMRLIKEFPNRVLADTLYWDSVRVRWQVLEDMTKFWEVFFPQYQSMDTVMDILKGVEELDGAGAFPIPIQDGWFENAGDPRDDVESVGGDSLDR